MQRTGRQAAAALSAALLACLASCETIYDYEGDCDPHWQVEFIYDCNMKFADAFPGPMGVGSVHLYIFDSKTRALVREIEDVAGEGGFGKDYRLPIEGIAPGRYDFVAWCGLDANPSFTGSAAAPQVLAYDAPAWRLADGITRADDAARQIFPLYYGRTADFTVDATQGVHTVPIHLMKDTNEFTIVLQHRSKPLNPADFDIEIVDDSSTLLWSNDIGPGSPTFSYRPWSVAQGSVDVWIDGETHGDEEPVADNLLVAHISTSRLMLAASMTPKRTVQPRLVITDRSAGDGAGRVVFEFSNLLDYLLMPGFHHNLVDAHNKPVRISDQEYLDREDTYNMHFIPDERGEDWFACELHILGWHMVFNDASLGGGF